MPRALIAVAEMGVRLWNRILGHSALSHGFPACFVFLRRPDRNQEIGFKVAHLLASHRVAGSHVVDYHKTVRLTKTKEYASCFRVGCNGETRETLGLRCTRDLPSYFLSDVGNSRPTPVLNLELYPA